MTLLQASPLTDFRNRIEKTSSKALHDLQQSSLSFMEHAESRQLVVSGAQAPNSLTTGVCIVLTLSNLLSRAAISACHSAPPVTVRETRGLLSRLDLGSLHSTSSSCHFSRHVVFLGHPRILGHGRKDLQRRDISEQVAFGSMFRRRLCALFFEEGYDR